MANPRESCASPRPMAFTVDFGPPEKKDHQKLALRDNIGRFAPKFKPRVGKQPGGQLDKEVVLVDEENNIAEESGGKDHDDEAASDAGTYTIDEDEEEVKVEVESEVKQ